MSRSTFSGPVLVGLDDASKFTSGVDPDGTTVTGPNWGFLKMAQSAPITQDTFTRFPISITSVGMVIPANSTLVRISVLITTAWGSGTMDIGMGWGNPLAGFDRNNLVDNLSMTSVGLVVVGPGDTDDLGGSPDDINNWMNNSSTNSPYGGDRCITAFTASGGSAGVGVLTVEYSQAVDLEAIA